MGFCGNPSSMMPTARSVISGKPSPNRMNLCDRRTSSRLWHIYRPTTNPYANEQDLSLRDFDCARLDAFRNSFKDLGITVKVGGGLAEAVHFVSRTRIHQALKAKHVIRHFAEQRHIIQPGCS